MQLDDLLVQHFGSSDVERLSPAALAGGLERLSVEFGLETDSGRRFAMWCLMHLLGSAPDLEVAFKDPSDRDAARDFMDMIDRAAPDGA